MEQFLKDALGAEQGGKIFGFQQEKLAVLIGQIEDKSESQRFVLMNVILPRIALYQVLIDETGDRKEAYDTVEKYMLTSVAPNLRKQYAALEGMQGYFDVFARNMADTLIKSDLWVTDITQNDSGALKYNITQCLWLDACAENGCPELCKVFCDADHVIYADMKEVAFLRSGTLATGSGCCDFCFLNRAKAARPAD
jgi:hypothetical protein